MKFKRFGALLVSAVLCIGMAAPAFAFEGDSTPVEQPVLPEIVEEDTVTITDEESGALTPEGNLTLVDDYYTNYSDGSGQQFITLVSKSGATFYLVIDRNSKGAQTVHFMNLVDEADLLALMEEDTWFEGHKDNIAPTTQESYKYCLKMLKEGFYHRPLTVIRPIDIENFLKGMRRDGRSDSYISKARGMLYQIFQKAEANDLVRRNPVRLAEKMRATGTAKRKEAFTTAEVAHLMKVLPDDRMGLSIRLLLGTGMRMQELLALEPQFIEEDGSVIHIRQAVKVVKGTVSIGSPKSKDSIRDIPVPLNVRPYAIKLRDTTDQFIWESPKTGLPCNPTHFRDVFRKSLEEAGDVRLLTPHSCRHTYVSQMQALGVDIQTIQSIVGHADTEMTEHYLHVQESIRQSAIQLFSEAFSA